MTKRGDDRFRMIGAVVTVAEHVRRKWRESDHDYAFRIAERLTEIGYRLDWIGPKEPTVRELADKRYRREDADEE